MEAAALSDVRGNYLPSRSVFMYFKNLLIFSQNKVVEKKPKKKKKRKKERKVGILKWHYFRLKYIHFISTLNRIYAFVHSLAPANCVSFLGFLLGTCSVWIESPFGKEPLVSPKNSRYLEVILGGLAGQVPTVGTLSRGIRREAG